MELVIDDRENVNFRKIFLERFPNAIVKRITVGDIYIAPNIIIERKTWNDMGASILDGRSHDQEDHMCDVRDNSDLRMFYLLEESKIDCNISLDAIRQCLVNKQICSSIEILESTSMKESCEIIARIIKSIAKISDKSITFRGNTIKTKKKAKKDLTNLGKLLHLIPRIRTNDIIFLSEKYKNISELVHSIEKNGFVSDIGPETNKKITNILFE
jgi:ERCC4-type nuclease